MELTNATVHLTTRLATCSTTLGRLDGAVRPLAFVSHVTETYNVFLGAYAPYKQPALWPQLKGIFNSLLISDIVPVHNHVTRSYIGQIT